MKFYVYSISILLAMSGTAASADSIKLGQRLKACGGTIELRKTDSGDLSIRLQDNLLCDTIVMSDYSSGSAIRAYTLQDATQTFTLSKEQVQSLTSDCRLNIGLYTFGVFLTNEYYVQLDQASCRVAQVPVQNGVSFQLSNNGNCKLMLFGIYSNQNVGAGFCDGANGKDVVSYEWSNNANCKRMINGQYSNVNVDKSLCEARF